ncbi:MAG: molybdopterin-dependent oxidoreductase [Acidimicrobiales bacterium]
MTGAKAQGVPVGRRVLLAMMGAGAVGILFGSTAQRLVGDALSPITSNSGFGLGSILPAANRFRIYSVTGAIPGADPATYVLKISGLCANPYSLSLAELQAMPATSLTKDFQCVTGWRVPSVHWQGVKLADLIDRSQPKAQAKALRFLSFDGVYSESLTLDQARRDDVIAAYQLEGKPLSADHGGPVRLYVAPMYGYKSAKWLRGIELIDKVEPGYWEQLGYDVNGWVGHSNGRHDVPTA